MGDQLDKTCDSFVYRKAKPNGQLLVSKEKSEEFVRSCDVSELPGLSLRYSLDFILFHVFYALLFRCWMETLQKVECHGCRIV
jgi:hypothetical protein